MCKDKTITLGLLVIVMWLMLKLNCKHEGMENPINENTNEKINEVITDDNQYLKSVGKYGGVDVWVYESKDNTTADKWREIDGGVYLHNSKTWWKDQQDVSDYVKNIPDGFVSGLRPENDYH